MMLLCLGVHAQLRPFSSQKQPPGIRGEKAAIEEDYQLELLKFQGRPLYLQPFPP